MAKAKKTTQPPRISDPATRYARDVVDGKIVAGPHVRAACRRHLHDLETAEERGLFWDVKAVRRVVGYFRDVLTVEIEERDDEGVVTSRAVPFVLAPWQCFIAGSLFGWKKGGLRRFRRAYLEAGKGCGKSPLAAGIGHYMLTATGKLRAEVYSAATDKDQAAILFRDAVAMWERSPQLHGRLVPSGVNPVWQLTDVTKSSFFKPISSDKKGKSGIRPYCALIDEIHEHPDNSVIEMLRAGTKGNQDALILEITNSGFDPKSVCFAEHEFSIRVANGDVENDAWFAYVCAMDPEDDVFNDETCWIKANPNLGVTIKPQFIREQVAEAVGMPSKEAMVRRLHFCEWTDSATAAFSRAALEVVFGDVDADALTESGYPCFGGLDLSRANDLTAFTLTWLLEKTVDKWRFASRTWFWTPKDTLHDRAKIDRAPYPLWVERQFMEAVPGRRIGYGWVSDALGAICAKYQPVCIGCDQYGLENLREQLTERGLSLPCVVHPQGFQKRVVSETKGKTETGADEVYLWMPDSINKLEAAVIEERIVIHDNPAMKMCMSAVIYETNRTSHRMFAKDKSTNRIDGAVSLAMSIGMATCSGGEKRKPTYDLFFA
ncbi:terminase large subunit [Bradyrhizobium sp. JYMT SZCCT0428]|uniref:terminase large subunit n=1 Tax=Bradyrhizobium sp. JYMT SZCCT0428 TaxID=2807673 RepID=UPI001BA7E603|nr:terminase TerL endonuclease subunit [Bradyrhizobium sp. JYMT SZCCT0428]MBR1154814.1 terminase large subunit [Bradyrhizobium sp. JYMT SZCCT0428]